MKKYQKPDVEMLTLTTEDAIMDIISASGGLYYGGVGDSGSFGTQISMNGDFSDF